MKKTISMFVVVVMCSFFLCHCRSTQNSQVEIESSEVSSIDFVEAVRSVPGAKMLLNSETTEDYLFLGHDVLSSDFTKPVYTVHGFDIELNDALSSLFSANPNITPYYLNQNGRLYVSKTDPKSFISYLSYIENNELVEFTTNHIDLAGNQYSILQSDFEYQLTNLDTKWTATFQALSQMNYIQPLQDGFLYSAMDEEKYMAFFEAAQEDEELMDPLFNLNDYIFSATALFMSYKWFDSDMANPVVIESPMEYSVDDIIEIIKNQQSKEENDVLPQIFLPMEMPITDHESNVVLWVDPHANKLHIQDFSQFAENQDKPKTTTLQMDCSQIDEIETYIRADGSVKWYLQKSTPDNHLIEVTYANNTAEIHQYDLPDTIPSPQFFSYDTDGHLMLIFWNIDQQMYQLGMIKDNSKEMFVSTIQLPPSIENLQGYSFDFIGNTKAIDETQGNVYWFQLHNPQTDRSSTSKSTHIIRCYIPPPSLFFSPS